jgi:hypothetical protein
VILYGLADRRLTEFGQVIDFYISKREAEAALADVLTDEPDWAGVVGVVALEFSLSVQ